ncbi:hypothetical protein Poli38472_008476 [Pythium oligandrum]|uniref:tRNA pseudouridine(55) synthase n=1 Tax=Pythium oligandrum TaxID=41045 RepID=A0A8K1FEF9_PYTOL|nr:hypothetical protein Poli38472_008476 [Pythium oligandrum]|eukprot:TMW55828.1 hypothetical protein Poli38472_008476 [Pythium oligandrum]
MARLRRARAAVSGFLNVRKPAGVTSHHCVAVVRKIFNTTEVGHAGTLDPMATGVLVMAMGRATKFLQYLVSDKEYRGVVRFGVTTSTDDITGDMLSERPAPWLTEETVSSQLPKFIGAIDQIPPKVSALKRDGKRYYELARANKDFDVKPRRVQIHGIDLLQFTGGEFPEATIDVSCGAGTYIRSIAREWGEGLLLPSSTEYVGGTLVSLERTRSGSFAFEDSLEFDTIRSQLEAGESPVCPIEDGVRHLPCVFLSNEAVDRWFKGGVVRLREQEVQSSLSLPFEALTHEMTLRIYDPTARFLGVSQVEQLHPSRKFILRKRAFIE